MATTNTHSGEVASLSVARLRISSGELFVDRETMALNLRPSADGSFVAGNSLTVPAGDTPTVVSVRSSVLPSTLQHVRSAAAIAVRRRRDVARIARLIRGLVEHAARQDFHSVAFPVFDAVRQTHQELLGSDQFEGNTCMILRYVRNSLMDCGWNQYKNPAVVEAVARFLDRVAAAETVGRQDAREAFKLFHQLGLRASLPVVIESGDTEEDEQS